MGKESFCVLSRPFRHPWSGLETSYFLSFLEKYMETGFPVLRLVKSISVDPERQDGRMGDLTGDGT